MMSGVLSQDEMDMLLDGFGAEEPSVAVGAADGNSEALKELLETISESFQGGTEGVGVTMQNSATLSIKSSGKVTLNEIEAECSESHFLLRGSVEGKASGIIALCMPGESAAQLGGQATGNDSPGSEPGDEELEALSEILSPILIGICRSISGKVSTKIEASDIQAQRLNSSGLPIRDEELYVIQGELEMEGVFTSPASIRLLFPYSLISELAALSGAAAGGGSTTDSAISSTAAAAAAAADPATAQRAAANRHNMVLLMDVPMNLTVELGRTRMYIEKILGLGEGSIIELDKLAGEPVDLMVNAKLIARGEVVVIDENFGVRVTDIVNPLERLKHTKGR